MADRFDVLVVLPPNQAGGKSTWQKIGVAFAQTRGGGFNIELAAAPIPQEGRIRLVMMEARAFPGRPAQRDRFPDRAPPAGGAGPAPAGDPSDSLDDLPW